jgi:hypothetical protein
MTYRLMCQQRHQHRCAEEAGRSALCGLRCLRRR